ncbi:IC cytokine homolog beag isoform 1-T2 [Glossina fuscipes fuscipes]
MKHKFNYERFNRNNFNIRYWSWSYRGCWHQTCPPSGSGALATANFATPETPASATEKKRSSHGGSSERGDLRRKKKSFYAALKKQEDNKLQELSEKYRDRARERRDGANPDYQNASTPGHGNNNAYRAVAPDLKSGIDAAERRKRNQSFWVVTWSTLSGLSYAVT